MSEETIDVSDEGAKAPVVKNEFAEQEALYKAQLSGLDKKVRSLQEELADKSSLSKTVEERIASLEAENKVAVKRADTVEAFSRAGLDDDWRALFAVSDPTEQANLLSARLSMFKSEVTKGLAGQFGKEPGKVTEGGNRILSAEELKGKSPQEINKLWDKGLIRGAK